MGLPGTSWIRWEQEQEQEIIKKKKNKEDGETFVLVKRGRNCMSGPLARWR